MLANLCVLTNYDRTSDFCYEHTKLLDVLPREDTRYDFYGNDGWRKGMPWIYYWKIDKPQPADEILLKSDRVKFKASFNIESVRD